MTPRHPILRPLLLLILLACFVSAQPLLAEEEQTGPAPVTNVEVIELKPRRLIRHADYVGHLIPLERVTLSSEVAGVVQAVQVVQGQSIDQGQELLSFEDERIRLNHQLAQSTHQLALDDYQREERLYKKKLSSKAKLDALKNKMEMTRLQLRLAKLDLDNCVVKAPFEGVVSKRIVEAGEYLGKGKPMVELMRIDQVKVELMIPERHIFFAQVGKEVDVSLDSLGGDPHPGVITAVSMEADKKSRSFSIEVTVPNPDRDFLPGMLSRVRMMTLNREGQLLIPRHAVLEGEKGSFVYLARGDENQSEKAVETQVELGVSLKGEVQVLKGLKEGDRLISVGQNMITDQEPIRILKHHRQTSDEIGEGPANPAAQANRNEPRGASQP